MSNASKMDTNAVFEMFEAISKKLDKLSANPIESTQIDLSAVETLTEELENVIEEVRRPAKVEYQHRHTIDIGSSKVFLSFVVMVLIILGLSYVVAEQRRNINQYTNNDLQYRYIKMQGQTNEENLYRLERQFGYGDSIKIIRNQVEKYEELVKEQAERMERARRNNEEVNKIMKEMKKLQQNENW